MATGVSTRIPRTVLATAWGVQRKLEDLETKLASSASGFGAAMLGVEDASGFYADSDLESVLAVIGAHIPVEIADPGDTEAIPVTQSGNCLLVTGGAETRTLADPTVVGQILVLHFLTDGGDCVITAASAVNAAGNTTLTFADAGDEIILVGSRDGASAYAWHVVENDGVALS